MKQNICPGCGSKNNKDAKFCTNCGKDLNEKEVIDAVTTDVVSEKEKLAEEVVDVKVENNPNNSKKNNNNIFYIILASFITFILTFGLCYLLFTIFNKPVTNEIIKEQKNVTITDTGIADAVEKVYDSVVIIKTYSKNQLYSTATGFVFLKDNKTAYILTNAHVVNGGDKFTATFTNTKEEELKLIGSDTYQDIAVLSIDADKIISVATIGSSEELRIGDTTFAVGAPIDSDAYSWTVTRGILSGKNREVEVSTGNGLYQNNSFVMEVLQTDTPINSGNSGGPLCNANGEVIGITNMKLSSDTIEGIGFAIPIETAVSYATDFINGKNVVRPYIGISLYYVSPTLYGNVNVSGVYVNSVEKGSAAEKAGIKQGDIITEINGVEIKSVAYFKYLLYKYEVGETVPFTIVRNNKEKKINITLGSSNATS